MGRISVDDNDFNRRLNLYQNNRNIDKAILFAPVSNIQPNPISNSIVQNNNFNPNKCAICKKITDIEWVQLPNCSGSPHVFCISCAERCVVKGDSHWRSINCSICGAIKPLFKDGITDVIKSKKDNEAGRISFENGSCPFHNE